MSSRPVRRPDSRVTHRQLAEHGPAVPAARPPSHEAATATPRPAAGVVLVAVQLAPHPDGLEPEELTERVRQAVHGRWVRVYGSPHQMLALGAWPVPADWAGLEPPPAEQVAEAHRQAERRAEPRCTHPSCTEPH